MRVGPRFLLLLTILCISCVRNTGCTIASLAAGRDCIEREEQKYETTELAAGTRDLDVIQG